MKSSGMLGLVLLVLAIGARAQSPAVGEQVKIDVSRDRFTDQTTISTAPMKVHGTTYDNLKILFLVGYRGTDPTKAAILMGVSQTTKDLPVQAIGDVHVLADDRRVTIGRFSKINAQNLLASVWEHQFSSTVEYDKLLVIAKSTKVEMRIGMIEVELLPAHIDAVRRLLKYIDGTLTFPPLSTSK